MKTVLMIIAFSSLANAFTDVTETVLPSTCLSYTASDKVAVCEQLSPLTYVYTTRQTIPPLPASQVELINSHKYNIVRVPQGCSVKSVRVERSPEVIGSDVITSILNCEERHPEFLPATPATES